ncbi:TRAP transporter large permease [Domibacillus mangrovi]|uniref:C4-dicarboxylate ABC transporter permease n=1 Tax=Domibacillus mangrovi TaxID=1714354 RepID=A0A1Q5NZC7_9BACI|nr:TRAP transporter large permease [Domibacillus mangrovi]OKL35286.1 C4-dicarboxylate ABC transporter permease [Domibacillus mangrovi]
MVYVLLISLVAFLILSFPIAVALGLSSIIAILFSGTIPLQSIAQKAFTSVDSFTLMAIPFFILAGTLMEKGGIAKRLIRFANSLVGSMTGGLGMVVVVTSMFFAAISGSGIAATAALGSILIPAMVKNGYDRSYAGALQAISGELGVIIPPSVSMILFGVATGVSISDLFLAGIIPGIMIALSLMAVVYVISKKRGYKGDTNMPKGEVLAAFKDALLALLMPVIILGGIYGGVFTPTEAAAIAVAYSLIISMFVYKEIRVKDLIGILSKSMITTSIVMFIISTAGIFSYILTREGVPQKIAAFFSEVTTSPIVFLLIINVVLLIIGMFFDGSIAIIILAPLLTPAAIALGIDPIHFGMVMIVNLAIGMCTPPLGVNLFVSCQIANIKLEQISKAVLPFLAVMIVDVLLISYIPQLSLFFVELFK